MFEGVGCGVLVLRCRVWDLLPHLVRDHPHKVKPASVRGYGLRFRVQGLESWRGLAPGSKTCASLNSRLESNKEEEEVLGFGVEGVGAHRWVNPSLITRNPSGENPRVGVPRS